MKTLKNLTMLCTTLLLALVPEFATADEPEEWYWEKPDKTFTATLQDVDDGSFDWVWQHAGILISQGEEAASNALRAEVSRRLTDGIPGNSLDGHDIAVFLAVASVSTEPEHFCYIGMTTCWQDLPNIPIYGPGWGTPSIPYITPNPDAYCDRWCKNRGHSGGQWDTTAPINCDDTCYDIWQNAWDSMIENWEHMWNEPDEDCAGPCLESWDGTIPGCSDVRDCMNYCFDVVFCDSLEQAVEDYYFCMLECCTCTAN